MIDFDAIRNELQIYGQLGEDKQPGDILPNDIINTFQCSRSHAYTIMKRAVDAGTHKYVFLHLESDFTGNRTRKPSLAIRRVVQK